MQGFKARLADDDRFVLPEYHADWSTGQVLAMSFMQGDPIETVETLDAPARDRIATDLVDLMLRELFEFGEMQSDPNFANFRFDPASRRIVLLDFGATRRFDPDLVGQYRDLLSAAWPETAPRCGAPPPRSVSCNPMATRPISAASLT